MLNFNEWCLNCKEIIPYTYFSKKMWRIKKIGKLRWKWKYKTKKRGGPVPNFFKIFVTYHFLWKKKNNKTSIRETFAQFSLMLGLWILLASFISKTMNVENEFRLQTRWCNKSLTWGSWCGILFQFKERFSLPQRTRRDKSINTEEMMTRLWCENHTYIVTRSTLFGPAATCARCVCWLFELSACSLGLSFKWRFECSKCLLWTLFSLV